jgi:hypothetical protein
MEPVRIKLYGLISVTRWGYRILLGLSAVLLLVLLGLSLWVRTRIGPDEPAVADGPDRPSALLLAARTFLGLLPWVVAVAALLVGIEAIVVLRRFAREEVLQRARLPQEQLPHNP